MVQDLTAGERVTGTFRGTGSTTGRRKDHTQGVETTWPGRGDYYEQDVRLKRMRRSGENRSGRLTRIPPQRSKRRTGCSIHVTCDLLNSSQVWVTRWHGETEAFVLYIYITKTYMHTHGQLPNPCGMMRYGLMRAKER